MRGLLIGLWFGVALATLASFGGAFHGLGDSLAVLRPPAALLLAVLSLACLALRPKVLGVIGTCLAVFSGWSLLPPFEPRAAQTNQTSYALYQKNLLWLLPDTRPVSQDIQSSGVDFVTLQELHDRNLPILSDLRAEYPTQHLCPFASVGRVAVLARWPAIPGQTYCAEGAGMAALQVRTPDGPLWVVSLHLHWPYPFHQAQQVQELRPALAALEGPVVIGGDFNMVPWSHTVQTIAQTTRTLLSGHVGGTFNLSYRSGNSDLLGHLPRLPIDHVLVPETARNMHLERRGKLGSDHHGVLAAFAFRGPES